MHTCMPKQTHAHARERDTTHPHTVKHVHARTHAHTDVHTYARTHAAHTLPAVVAMLAPGTRRGPLVLKKKRREE